MHAFVKKSDVFKILTAMEDSLDCWQRVMFLSCHFIELLNICNDLCGSVGLWNNKHGHAPFCSMASLENSKTDLTEDFFLNSVPLVDWD